MPKTNDNKKDNGVFYITHSGELLFWLIIVLIIVAVFSLTYIIKDKNAVNDYRIFLQDVDGLIVGSPVRMMGIDVGYVKKIKPINDEVYVKFIITKPEVYIPQGTIATVEFSGMAGSKSLELYLPDNNTYIDQNTALLEVSPPKRLNDAVWLLSDMYKKIGSIIYNSTQFGDKLNSAVMHTPNSPNKVDNFEEFVEYSNNFLDDYTQKATDLRKTLGELSNKDGKEIFKFSDSE